MALNKTSILGNVIAARKAAALAAQPVNGWVLVNGSIVRGEIAPNKAALTPAIQAESDRLGVLQAAWEASLPRQSWWVANRRDVFKIAAVAAAAVGGAALLSGAGAASGTAAAATTTATGTAAGTVTAATAAVAPSITIAGMSTGISTGIAGLDAVIATTATGAAMGAASSALQGGSASAGAKQGAAQGALSGASAALADSGLTKSIQLAIDNTKINLGNSATTTGGNNVSLLTDLQNFANSVSGGIAGYNNPPKIISVPQTQPQPLADQTGQPVTDSKFKNLALFGGAALALLGLVLVARR